MQEPQPLGHHLRVEKIDASHVAARPSETGDKTKPDRVLKGKVFYTDGDLEKVHRAQMYFRMAGVAKRIEVKIGDALAIVKKTPGMFDVIFIDVDKNQYPAALHAVRPKLRRGGLLIADNTIWSGKAARPAPEEDKDTKGVQEFNRMVYASKELYPVLIPLRDGLTICRKS